MAKFKSEEIKVGIPSHDDFSWLFVVEVSLPLGLDAQSGEVAYTPRGTRAAWRFNGGDWSTWLSTCQTAKLYKPTGTFGLGNTPFAISIESRKVVVAYGFDLEEEETFEGSEALSNALGWLSNQEEYIPNAGLVNFNNARFITGESYN